METRNLKFKIRLGLFVAIGLLLLTLGIFIIGKQKNTFSSVIRLLSDFRNVSGLQVGNNVRFSGINVGTVDHITILNDTMVRVGIIVESDVRSYIKKDCILSIGSEGLIGDRFISISQSETNAQEVSDGEMLASSIPLDTDAIMSSLAVSAANAEIISSELADIMWNLNHGNGTLGRLINDSSMADNLESTMHNLKTSSKSLDQNMNAVKKSFLLKRYFKKKQKTEASK